MKRPRYLEPSDIENFLRYALGEQNCRAFEEYPELQHIRTTVVREHGASRRVLEKCGMRHIDDITEQ